MLPAFLVPETTVGEEGNGPGVDLGPSRGKSLLLTLGITRIIEQESLDVSIWGSAGGAEWGTRPLAVYPQKFYCGNYNLEIDLSGHPEVTHLRAQWKVGRWGRGAPAPLFEFYLFVQETVSAMTAKSA